MLTNRWRVRGKIIVLGVLLGGCAAGGSLGDRPTVGGQIQDWASLLGSAPGTMQVRVGTRGTASGSIDSKGNFAVTLPGADDLMGSLTPPAFSMGPAGCTGQIRFSPTTVLSAVADFQAESSSAGYGLSAGLVSESTSVLYAFFDQDASASGTLSCPVGPAGSPAASVSMNLGVSKGWNNLLLDYNQDGGIRNVTEPQGVLPMALRWSLFVYNNPIGTPCFASVDCVSGQCGNDDRCECSNSGCTEDADCCNGAVCSPMGSCCGGHGSPCTSQLDCCDSMGCDSVTNTCK